MRSQDILEVVQVVVHQQSPGANAGEAESGPAAMDHCLLFLAGAFIGGWWGSMRADFPDAGHDAMCEQVLCTCAQRHI